jgi:hypothetical protein
LKEYTDFDSDFEEKLTDGTIIKEGTEIMLENSVVRAVSYCKKSKELRYIKGGGVKKLPISSFTKVKPIGCITTL